jgi:phenylalanyl-tRNA synthetase beta chain
MKPINNIVDITNFIMLDLGQPLHAFDAAKVKGCEIVVRKANAGEEITTLDGTTRKLRTENLLITDPDKAIAIAGVMGGENSEIDSTTTKIILESAQFSPTVTRKSSKLLNLSTDASYRFERGVDPLGVKKALAKAVKMIKELAGGEIIDLKSEVASPYKAQENSIPYEKINSLLGLNLKNIEIDEILTRLAFKVSNGVAQIPSWRRDIAIWQDLAEEVGRIYDLNKIPTNPLPEAEVKTISDYYKKEYIKDILVENGFSEVATYSIIGMEDAKIANLETGNLLEIANPVQPENKFLSNSLVPGLLKSIAKNRPSIQFLYLKSAMFLAKTPS